MAKKKKINFEKEIWEGWTVGDFIEELKPHFDKVQSGLYWHAPFKNREELKLWCMDNQPYYKKYIKDVVDYFEQFISKC